MNDEVFLLLEKKSLEGEYDEAIELAEKHIAYSDNEELALMTKLGSIYIDKGDFEKGKKILDYILRTGFETPWLFDSYGVYYARKQDDKAALNCFLQALEKDDTRANTHRNVAMIYKSIGNVDLYREHLIKALELDPENLITRIAVGVGILEEGRLEEGIEILSDILTYKLNDKLKNHVEEIVERAHEILDDLNS